MIHSWPAVIVSCGKTAWVLDQTVCAVTTDCILLPGCEWWWWQYTSRACSTTNKQSGPYTDIHLYIDTTIDNLFRSGLNAVKVQYTHACVSNEAVITRSQTLLPSFPSGCWGAPGRPGMWGGDPVEGACSLRARVLRAPHPQLAHNYGDGIFLVVLIWTSPSDHEMNESRRTAVLCPTVHKSCSFAYENYVSLYLTEHDDFDKFYVRYQTFCFFPSWGLPLNTCYNMVQVGFYYTGDDLIVKCCACKSIVMRFRKGDDPFGAAAHRSNCPFSIREMENGAAAASAAVSYTHLTLPTIYSV